MAWLHSDACNDLCSIRWLISLLSHYRPLNYYLLDFAWNDTVKCDVGETAISAINAHFVFDFFFLVLFVVGCCCIIKKSPVC